MKRRRWSKNDIDELKLRSEHSRTGQLTESDKPLGDVSSKLLITIGKPGQSKRKNVVATIVEGVNGPIEVRIGFRKRRK